MVGVQSCIRLWMDGVIQLSLESVSPGWELVMGMIPLLLGTFEGIWVCRVLELILWVCLFGDRPNFLGEDLLTMCIFICN